MQPARAVVSSRSDPDRWISILLLWSAGICAAFQFAKVGVVLQPLAQSLALSGEAAAALMGAAGLAGVVMGVAGAGLIGTLGAGRVLLGSLAFAAALSLAQTLMPDYALFYVLRLIEGITNLFIVIAAPSLIVQQAPPRHLAVALGLWSTFYGVAFALAAALVLLYPEGLAVQGLFLTHAVACTGLVFGLGRRLSARSGTRTDWRAVRAAFTPAAHALAYSRLRIVLPGAIFLFHAAASVGVVVFLPPSAPTAPTAKALAVAMPVATFCGTLLSGFVARGLRLAPGHLLVAGLILASMLALGIAGSGGSFAVVAGLLALTLGAIQGWLFILVPWLARDSGEETLAFGVIVQTGGLANTIAPPLLAALVAGGAGGGLVPFLVCGLALGGLLAAIGLRCLPLRP